MQNNSKEKIKIKNFNDILKDNLRILDSENQLNKIENNNDSSDQESKIQKSSFNRESFSNDEHNLTILDLPDISKGKKSLRKIRFLLHREIRDWIVSPLERKQSEINSKIIRNCDEIYSELDDITQKINTMFEEFIQTNYSIRTAIRKTYVEILRRNPDDESLQYYFYKIALGELKFDQLKNELKQSKEYQKIKEEQDIVNKITSSIKKPIFIIGVPRSGTTLVHSILCNHKDLAWVSDEDLGKWLLPIEQFQIDSLYKWLKTNNKKIPMSEEALFVFGKDLGDGLKHFGTPPKDSTKIPIEGEILWREIFGTNYVEDITNEKKIKLGKEILSITKNQKKTRFICKAPNNSFRLFAIQKIFPDAKFINMARDPRAVVSSMSKRYEEEGEFDIGMYEKTTSDVKFQSLEPIEKFAWFYKEFTDAIEKFSTQNKNSVLTIYYENLIQNPTSVIQNILEFCSLSIPVPIDDMSSTIQQNSLDKWKKNLSQEDIEKISNIVSGSINR